MCETAFASSPLITPARLQADRSEAFKSLPGWARGGTSAGPDDDLSADVFLVRIDGVEPHTARFPFISAAILVELTRYGNTLVTNSNRKGGEVYAKLSFARHTKDHMPVARIIMDALPRQAVYQMGDLGDYRPEFLEKRGAGKPTKIAREVAIAHGIEMAREAGADVAAYETNLRALFDLHDDILLGRFDY